MVFSDAEILEAAIGALERAGGHGLSAFQLTAALVEDRVLDHVAWGQRNRIGLEVGVTLVRSGRAQVTGKNRFTVRPGRDVRRRALAGSRSIGSASLPRK